MVETQGGEWGLQVLQAVQALGTRMERIETQLGHLTSQVENLDRRMDKLEVRMNMLESQMVKLEVRMDKAERWRERLGGENLRSRDDMSDQLRHLQGDLRQWRAETQDGLRRMDARVDVTSGAVFMLAMELRGPLKVEFSAELGRHLDELEPH